jgi:hypothetical protein
MSRITTPGSIGPDLQLTGTILQQLRRRKELLTLIGRSNSTGRQQAVLALSAPHIITLIQLMGSHKLNFSWISYKMLDWDLVTWARS